MIDGRAGDLVFAAASSAVAGHDWLGVHRSTKLANTTASARQGVRVRGRRYDLLRPELVEHVRVRRFPATATRRPVQLVDPTMWLLLPDVQRLAARGDKVQVFRQHQDAPRNDCEVRLVR